MAIGGRSEMDAFVESCVFAKKRNAIFSLFFFFFF